MRKERAQSYSEVKRFVDAGLRQYMLNVFSYMSVGLLLTAIVTYVASLSEAFMSFLFSSHVTFFIVALAPVGIVFYLGAKINDMSAATAKTLFFVYAASVGLSMASIMLIYTTASIVSTFFVTSSMFLSMVIYGYSTQKDLTSWGSFLLMGLVGILIAGIVNAFMRSSVASLVISAIGVIVFTGLTAYDAQRIKSYYLESDSSDTSGKKAVFGALSLYMDFINLFMHLLRFLGTRRD
ncbi:membrane protein [Alphaproteobacteria bacterium]|nr:membrane protein [Alphaproteobacteria bacterium]